MLRKHRQLLLVGTAAFLVGVVFIGQSSALPGNQPPQPVDVQNPVLPISGTVDVDNFPAVQQVHEVSHPAFQPVQRTIEIDDWSVAFNQRVHNFQLPAVPSGKVLVIQQVSVHARVPSAQQVKAELLAQGADLPVHHEVPLTMQGTFDGFDEWVGTEALTAYAGSSFNSIRVERNSDVGIVGPIRTVRVAITGYLVDTPS